MATRTKDLGITKKSSKKTNKKGKKKSTNSKPIKTNNAKMTITNNGMITNVNGVTIPPPNPPPGMKRVYSGIMIGNVKTRKHSSMSMSYGTSGGKMILSGIRLNGQVVLENFEFEPNGPFFAFDVKDDGFFIGSTKVIDCDSNDSISIDHVYAKSSGSSALSFVYL